MRLRPTCVPLMAMVLFFTLVNAVAPVVDVSHSKYRGNDLGNGVTHWLGIRYAAPPLGDLRFMPPQDPVRNRQTKNANKFRLKCVSQSAKARFIGKSQSEDCLFLNVFAPSNASRHAKLPVFVYIQGGGFNDNSRPKIDGADLIRASDMKIVVVTLNYPESISASPIKTVEQASYQAESFIENVGCSSEDAIACMRTKTIAEIIAANIKVPYP
ncbi:cholinesterase precursor [Fusarium fujikuroi]|nr:cholinesterase precursor [Fusarium fujikuroi]